MNKILFGCSVGEWKKYSQSRDLSPAEEKGWESLLWIWQRMDLNLSPTIKIVYQLQDLLSLQTRF